MKDRVQQDIGAKELLTDWNAIDWKLVRKRVKNLRQRIYRVAGGLSGLMGNQHDPFLGEEDTATWASLPDRGGWFGDELSLPYILSEHLRGKSK